MIQLTIPMRCMPKKRPRVSAVNTYMPDKYTAWKADAATYMRAGYRGDPLSGKLALAVIISFRCAPSSDLDNLAGAVMDAGNGLLWVDDRQIYKLAVIRQDRQPADEITLEVTEL